MLKHPHGFFLKNHEYTPLSEIPQCFKICIRFPRHVYKDMVLFSAFVLRAIRFSRSILWKPGQSDKCLSENWDTYQIVLVSTKFIVKFQLL